MEGQNIVASVIGPIAHSPSDLQLLVKALVDLKPWEHDPAVVPLPWRGEEQAELWCRTRTSGLCFGVMAWDGVVMPHPPIQRVINETVAKLRAKGHEVRLKSLIARTSTWYEPITFRSSNGRHRLTLRPSRSL